MIQHIKIHEESEDLISEPSYKAGYNINFYFYLLLLG